MRFATIIPGDLRDRFNALRERTRGLFGLLRREAFDQRPIPLRHPLRFYEGHLAAFNANVLWNAGFLSERPSPALGDLFARGIDPADEREAAKLRLEHWPSRTLVQEYIDHIDDLMYGFFSDALFSDAPLYERLLTCIEHEEMHQETLIYLIHQLGDEFKEKPANLRRPSCEGAIRQPGLLPVPGGVVRLGAVPHKVPFGWDNEFPQIESTVRPFSMMTHKVTNGEFLAFVEAGGYEKQEWWSPQAWNELQTFSPRHPLFWQMRGGAWRYKGLFEEMALPLSWPVYVSRIEAEAYARWRGMRLPTEAEFHLAAFGENDESASREYEATNFNMLEPLPIGRAEEPKHPFGHAELVGNGWEWTCSVFEGFPGFQPYEYYRGYSADFFDGRHYVVKGGSQVTAAPLLRSSFRNWFRDTYRYAYTTFRCAIDH